MHKLKMSGKTECLEDKELVESAIQKKGQVCFKYLTGLG